MITLSRDFERGLKNKIQVKASKLLNKKTASTRIAIQALARDWKIKALRLLSKRRPGGVKRNVTRYPYMVSKQLRSSLHYKTKVTQRKYGATINITYGFSPATRAGGFDYGLHLNESERPYGGYRERIFNRLEGRVRTLLKRFV